MSDQSPAGGQNMVPSTDDGKSFGPKVISKTTSLLNHGLNSALTTLVKIEATWAKIEARSKKTAENAKKVGAPGTKGDNSTSTSKLGMAEMPKKPGVVAEEPAGTGAGTGAGGLGGLGVSRGALLGLGVVAGVGALASMTPSTMAAVTQRMAADTTAGISGMSANSLIKQSNKAVGGGVTSVGSPTQSAMAVMYSGGFTASSLSSKNIMSSLGGLSALTGGSNEQMATALSQMNGMNFLRMGIRIRDNNGDLKPINTIVNDVWKFMYGSRKVTKEQVSMVYNPGSKANMDVQTIAGGDPNLFAAIAGGLIARAGKGTGLSGADLKDPNKALNALGVGKDAPVRVNFKNNTANNNLLDATQKGLVGGYDAALNTNTTLTNGMTDLANAVPQVTDALMKFKGFLQTFPNTGPVGGGISGAVGGAVGFGTNMLMAKAMFGGGGGGLFGGGAGGLLGGGGGAAAAAGVEGPLMANGAFTTAAGAGGMGVMAKLGSVLSKGGKFGVPTGILGSGSMLAKAGRAGLGIATYMGMEKAQKWLNKQGANLPSWLRKAGNFAFDLGQGALSGLAAGGLPGAVAGTGMGAVGATQSLLQGGTGGGGGAGNQPLGVEGSGSGELLQKPITGPMVITSDFGFRKDPIAKRAGKSGANQHHNGVDYACPPNTPVMAAAAGKVVTVAFDANGYGNYIIIDHGSIKTLYGHLSRCIVRPGQVVTAGERIGLSGSTGAVTGPHLHFEVRKGFGRATATDPKPYLNGKKSFLSKVFNAIKGAFKKVASVVGSAVSAVGSALGFTSNQSSSKGSLLNTKGISGMSSPSLSALISSTTATGEPLSYEDIQKVVSKSSSGSQGSVSFIDTQVDPSTGKTIKFPGVTDTKVNTVSGDSGSMAFGSRVGLIKALYRHGFKPGKRLDTAFAVALAESGGRAHAHNPYGKDDSYGVFQLNMKNDDPTDPNMGKKRLKLWHLQNNEQLYDPDTNLTAAFQASNKGTWWAHWATYSSGKFVQYLDDAAKAGKLAGIPSYDVGTTRVPQDQLALVHKDEMIVPADAASKIRNNSKTGAGGAGNGVNINVDMKVQIANADPHQAERLFQEFKTRIAKELRLKGMGTF